LEKIKKCLALSRSANEHEAERQELVKKNIEAEIEKEKLAAG
jgi:hypothetical protein